MSAVCKIKHKACDLDGNIVLGDNDLWNFLVVACSHTLEFVINKCSKNTIHTN